MNRSSLLAAAAVAIACVTLSACEGETLCDYPAPAPPSGDFIADLKGCWQAPGIYVLGQDPYREVVYHFTGEEVQEGSGVYRWREVQSPNALYAGGNVFQYAYRIAREHNDAGTLVNRQLPDGGVSDVILSETELVDLGGLVTSTSYEQGLPHAEATITSTSLLLDYYFIDTLSSVFGAAQPFRRAVCRGFGFDGAQNACAVPAGAQQ